MNRFLAPFALVAAAFADFAIASAVTHTSIAAPGELRTRIAGMIAAASTPTKLPA